MLRVVVSLLLFGSFAHAAKPSRVDAILTAAWKKARITPAPEIDDASFLRRAFLDLAGTLPPPDLVVAFTYDKRPAMRQKKREQIIDELLVMDDFNTHFASLLERALVGRNHRDPFFDRVAFLKFLTDSLRAHHSWAQISRELLTAVGDNRANGAVNFFIRYRSEPADMAGRVARVFLGTQIQCAQCHNHPYEKWTQEDFRRFTAIFMAVRGKPLDAEKTPKPRNMEVFDTPKPRQGKPEFKEYASHPPATFDGTDLSAAPDRRVAFADWLVGPGKTMFARALVNRVWDHLLARAFVEPVDDFRPSNAITLEPLLNELTSEFIASNYDLRALIRTICLSEAYARSSQPAAAALWSRYPLRPMSGELLLAALAQATNFEQLLSHYAAPDQVDKLKEQIQNGVQFLFDVDEASPDEDRETTIPQALLFLNSRLVSAASSALPFSVLHDVLTLPTVDDRLRALYLRTLSRQPTTTEIDHLSQFIAEQIARPTSTMSKPMYHPGGPDPAERALKKAPLGATSFESQAYEDIFWVLLNSSEFSFRH